MTLLAFLAAAALSTNEVGGSLDRLAAAGPAAAYKTQLMDFGRLVGKWSMDVQIYNPDGSVKDRHEAFWEFGWVLEGRAIQDVFISEPVKSTGGTTATSGEFGATIRMYQPKADNWNIVYLGPRNGQFVTFVAHREGGDVVLERTEDNGEKTRWTFDRVEPHSFRWRATSSTDGGQHWKLDELMTGRRM